MKKKYKVTNWKEYNQGLKQRGSLTFWLGDDLEGRWYEASFSGKRGRPLIYSDICMKILATLRHIFKLGLRQLEGFVVSIFNWLGIDLKVPEFSRLSRRMTGILSKIKFPDKEKIGHVVIDSSGIKVYGEKEWLETKKGKKYQRRKWRKIHIGVDGEGNILDLKMTNHKTNDRQMANPIIESIGLENINEVLGDGGYDGLNIYSFLEKNGIITLIPPPPNAKVHEKRDELRQRNKTVQCIRDRGYHAWVNKNNFGRRNRVENTFYRIKTIFGRQFMSRVWKNQEVESKLIATLLNQMTTLGMPKCVKIS